MSDLKTPTGFSGPEREAWASEVLDTRKALLHCGTHSYLGSETPPKPIGCVDCWKAYWWFKIASTPPHLRRERLEQAVKTIRDANQLIEAGQWDFQVDSGYPVATIEKDGFDDITRDYRKKSLVLTDA